MISEVLADVYLGWWQGEWEKLKSDGDIVGKKDVFMDRENKRTGVLENDAETR